MMAQISKRSKSMLRLQDLPSATLATVGYFLTRGEAVIAVRCCKENAGLKPILEGFHSFEICFGTDPMPPMKIMLLFLGLRSIALGNSSSTSLQPLFESDIGSSLKKLHISKCTEPEDFTCLARNMPNFASLEDLNLSLGSRTSACEDSIAQDLFFQLPRLPYLHHVSLEGLDENGVKSLALVAASGTLPALKTLCLPGLRIERLEIAECLRIVLTALRDLKKLNISICNSNGRNYWELIACCLGVHIENFPCEMLPRLESLVLANINDSWRDLGKWVRRGRLPCLKEVRYVEDDELGQVHRPCPSKFWFQVDAETTRAWFELIQNRGIQTFNSQLTFDSTLPEIALPLVREFLMGMLQPLETKLTATISTLDLGSAALDPDTCEFLTLAIRSQNLRSIKSLKVCFNPAPGAGFASLGAVVSHAFLPSLISLAISVNASQKETQCINQVQAFFNAIPDGLELEEFSTSSYAKPKCEAALIFMALSALKSRSFLENVHSVIIKGPYAGFKDLNGLSAALLSGFFPSLRTLIIEGFDPTDSGDICVMDTFCLALSQHAGIEEFVFADYFGDFLPILLERLQAVLFKVPASFPALCTLSFGVVQGGCAKREIKRFYKDIRPMKPSNLKIVSEIDGDIYSYD